MKTGKKKFDDSDTKQAVREWVKDPATALETYADISDSNTGAVTDMSELSKDAKDFDEDISQWDTSELFKDMKGFDEDISRWDVSHVEDMSEIFSGATSFDKDCIKDWARGLRNKKFTNEELKNAVKDLVEDSISANALYVHISTWDTSEVTDMSELFKGKNAFDEDISGWDVSRVTRMGSIFSGATSFDKEYIKSWPEYWKRFSNDIMLRILIKDRGLEHGQRHGYVPHVLCCFDV